MKGVKIAMIAVLCTVMLGLCVLLGLGLSGRLSDNRWGGTASGGYALVLEEEISPEELNAVSIDFSKNSNDVMLYEADGDNIVIKEYANYDVPDSEKTAVKAGGGALKIEGRRRSSLGFSFFGFGTGSGYTEVYLPKDYNGSLDICTAGGDVRAYPDLTPEEELSVTVASGDIYLQNVSTQKACFTSASGEVRLQGLTAEKAEVTTASGDVKLQELTAGKAEITTASGDVDIPESRGQAEIGTASGDVRIFFAEPAGEISINTASGEVTLKLPADAAFAFEADTASGDIDTFFDDALQFSKRGNHAEGEVNGSSRFSVGIETASGDIRIMEY